jgi:UDP-N-acetylmuramate--alanine ligase
MEGRERRPKPQRAHLVGIAGSGMRALADVLLKSGCRLSGSDLNVSSLSHLKSAGVCLFQGHAAGQVPPDSDEVIASDAVPADNPELQAAWTRGIPISSYAEVLGRLRATHRTIGIAGTHGKSSTTAMLGHLLTLANLDPTVVCGATPLEATSGGRAGKSGLFVVEACEYRENFRHLRPFHAAILGIEPDHFDCYDSLAQIEGAFGRFAGSIAADGLVLIRHDCPSTQRVAAAAQCPKQSFGLSADADWSAHVLTERRGCYDFQVRRFGRPFCEVRLQVPGLHNVLNALAAAALATASGVAAEQIASGLASFAGLHRRMEVCGTWRGAAIIDDYAHHPTEVRAALVTARQMYPGLRLWCLVQPHQASRTERLLAELAASLQNADKVLIAEIFRAREGAPRPGEVTAADLARETACLGVEVLLGHTAREIIATLKTQLSSGDVLITLGASDMTSLQPWNGQGGSGNFPVRATSFPPEGGTTNGEDRR